MEDNDHQGSCPENRQQPSQQSIDIDENTTTPYSITTVRNTNNIEQESKKRSRTEQQPESQLYSAGNFNLDTALEELEQLVLNFFQIQKTIGLITKEQALNLLRRVSLEAVKLSTKALVQEEKISAAFQQVCALQSRENHPNQHPTSSSSSYLQAAMNANATEAIMHGKQFPIPQVIPTLKHAPAETVIIIRAKQKGVLPDRKTQEQFRKDLHEAVGFELGKEISTIRNTRYGGYVLIMSTSEHRDNVANRIRETNLAEPDLIVSPQQKKAKMLCREVSEGVSLDEVLRDFYGRHNPELKALPQNQRQAVITPTRLGWTFELTSLEAAAISSQGNKIRFGFGREIRLEEHIPMHQCYRCCRFGHSAADCMENSETCRLCAARGHSGRECPKKEDKQSWRCHNCIIANQKRGMRLDINHAAAQLHRCAAAQHEKDTKKVQLAATGIFVHREVSKLTTMWNQQQQSPTEKPTKNRSINSSTSSLSNATPLAHSSSSSSSSRKPTVSSTSSSITQKKNLNFNISSASFLSTASFITSSSFSSRSFLNSTAPKEGTIFSTSSSSSSNQQKIPKNVKFGVANNQKKSNAAMELHMADEDMENTNEQNEGGVNYENYKNYENYNNQNENNNDACKGASQELNENGWIPVTRGRGGRGRGRGRGSGMRGGKGNGNMQFA